jgi:hypothetical protein
LTFGRRSPQQLQIATARRSIGLSLRLSAHCTCCRRSLHPLQEHHTTTCTRRVARRRQTSGRTRMQPHMTCSCVVHHNSHRFVPQLHSSATASINDGIKTARLRTSEAVTTPPSYLHRNGFRHQRSPGWPLRRRPHPNLGVRSPKAGRSQKVWGRMPQAVRAVRLWQVKGDR